VLFKETSKNPDLFATYESTGHVITGSATVRFGGVGKKVHHEEPRPELPEEPPPRHSWE
jgi:hypothetical protein